MNFKQLVEERFSCRDFSEKRVADDLLLDIFDTCRLAPSAVNFQPWKFIVVNSELQLGKLYKSYKRDWIKSASTIIIALGDTEKAWTRADGKNHVDIDVSIIIDHITLAATEKGLATCWVCNFNVEKIESDFCIPEKLKPIALIPIGYANEGVKPIKKRLETKEFIYFNSIR